MENVTQKMVQYMMSHGCVREKDLEEKICIFKNIDDPTLLPKNDVYKLVQKVNSKLKPYNMMIRSTFDQNTTENYFVMISTVDNEITHAATHLTPKQFELFKFVLQAIVQSPAGRIDQEEFKKLADKATVTTSCKLRSSSPEHLTLLSDWCEKRWLTYVSNSKSSSNSQGDKTFIALGVRTMAELDVFIQQNLAN